MTNVEIIEAERKILIDRGWIDPDEILCTRKIWNAKGYIIPKGCIPITCVKLWIEIHAAKRFLIRRNVNLYASHQVKEKGASAP